MASLPPLPALTRLEVAGTDVDYPGLTAVGQLESLRRLSLADCLVGEYRLYISIANFSNVLSGTFGKIDSGDWGTYLSDGKNGLFFGAQHRCGPTPYTPHSLSLKS